MTNSVRREKKKIIISVIIITIIAVIVFCVVWILTNHKETLEKTTYDKDETSSVVCSTSNQIEESFFDFDGAESIYQEIKALFINKKLNRIFYSYTGQYESADDAKTKASALLANYNIYLGKHNISLDTINSSIDSVDSTVRIDLYTNSNSINVYTGKLFLLSSSEFNSAKSADQTMFAKYYKNKGLTCNFQ
jgi:hypothetical protein